MTEQRISQSRQADVDRILPAGAARGIKWKHQPSSQQQQDETGWSGVRNGAAGEGCLPGSLGRPEGQRCEVGSGSMVLLHR